MSRRVRLLGLEKADEEQRRRRSWVLVQIDGLSYPTLRQALDSGKLPFLASLIKEDRARVGPWRAMLPASTSAFQAGLFYGNNDDIPGFFWYDKRRGKTIKMNSISAAGETEDDVRERVKPFKGLLSEGSAYASVFIGGAENTLLTFSHLLRPKLNVSTRPSKLLLFAASQVMLALRLIYYAGVEFLLGFYDLIRGLFTEKNKFLEFKFLVPRIACVVLCREVVALAAILDILRGVGPVFLNYLAYDEHAHHRGPRSRFAMWTLKGIDASIRRVYRAVQRAEREGTRAYDLYVCSDHGQTEAIPFQELLEQEPDRHFDLAFRATYGLTGAERAEARAFHETERRRRGRFVRGQRARHSEPRVSRQVHRAQEMGRFAPGPLRRLYEWLLRPARPTERQEAPAPETAPVQHIRVVSTGTAANLYYVRDRQPLTFEDFGQQFPEFLGQLAAHAGIGFALTRTRSAGARVGFAGRWLDLYDEAALEQHVPSSLARLIGAYRDDLCRWANMPSAGDVLLFGQRAEDFAVIDYSYERGGHGGLSPDETRPFLLVPAERCEELWPEFRDASSETLGLADLHERLKSYRDTGDPAVGDAI